VFALFVALAFLAGCGARVENVPSELIGTWETDAPEYAHRYLEISPVQLVFGTGRGSERHRLRGIRLDPALGGAGGTGYALVYEAPGGQLGELPLIHSPDTGSIRLAYRSEVWSRTREAGE